MDIQVGDIIKLENNQFVTVSETAHNVPSTTFSLLLSSFAASPAILVFIAFSFQLTSLPHVRGGRFF